MQSNSTPVFEDFPVGSTVESAGRTIETSDILTFAGLTGDFFPLHVDEEYAKATQFGGRVAHGPMIFGIALGMVWQTRYFGAAIEAMLGCDGLRTLKPVRPGDTVRVIAEVVEAAEWKRPGFGVLAVLYTVLNQRDETVMVFTIRMLARRRAAGGTTE